jgi:hypothetical protein
VKLLTYLPAVGLVGLALYHLFNQHDPTAALQDLFGAGAIIGIGGAVHATNGTVNG